MKKEVQPIDFNFYPNGTKEFIIVEEKDLIKVYFYEGKLTFNEGFYVSSSSGLYTAVWNDIEKMWEQENKDSFGKINAEFGDWQAIIYSSEKLNMTGMQSEPIQMLMQGREKIEGFTPNPMLDFSYLNSSGSDFFIIDNEDYLFKIKLNFSSLSLVKDGGPVKIKSSADNYFVGVFKGDGYMGDPYVEEGFESYHPYDFIIGGSKELLIGEELIVNKIGFMDFKDWQLENI